MSDLSREPTYATGETVVHLGFARLQDDKSETRVYIIGFGEQDNAPVHLF